MLLVWAPKRFLLPWHTRQVKVQPHQYGGGWCPIRWRGKRPSWGQAWKTTHKMWDEDVCTSRLRSWRDGATRSWEVTTWKPPAVLSPQGVTAVLGNGQNGFADTEVRDAEGAGSPVFCRWMKSLCLPSPNPSGTSTWVLTPYGSDITPHGHWKSNGLFQQNML